MLLRGSAKIVKDYSGLDARNAARGIDFQDVRHVLRKIKHNGSVTTLSRERRASTARQQRSVMLTTQRDSGEHIFFIARNYHADRHLPVIGAIGCVDGTAARVKTNLSTKVAAESSFECGHVKLRGMSVRWGNVLRHKAQNIFVDVGA